MEASSPSSRVLTASAALGPLCSIRMSQRSVFAEGKAARHLIQLHGRNAQIERHAVGLFADQCVHLAEPPVQ